ncbi:MAG: glycosyltransferase family 2 protein [Bacteroidota bacterium]|nr:glycosyltransferase family 2 protein [Bacteroidota bacterium]
MKLSLITVSYNSASTIRDTFESVLAQTYTDIEYLVIDGQSKDGTIDIINEYAPRFKGRMRWICEKDHGIYDAMNKGIRMATGDIVGIINSDDFYHNKDAIENIIDTFKQNPDVEATFADVRFVRPNDLTKTVRYYSSKRFSPWMFRFGFMPAHPTFFTYKNNFDKYGYYKPDYQIAADYELLIRFLYNNRLKYKYMPIDLLKMRTGGTSTASIKSTSMLNQEIVKACKENNINTNLCILYFKYVVKIWEIILTKS